jgi:hypothetical protein
MITEYVFRRTFLIISLVKVITIRGDTREEVGGGEEHPSSLVVGKTRIG